MMFAAGIAWDSQLVMHAWPTIHTDRLAQKLWPGSLHDQCSFSSATLQGTLQGKICMSRFSRHHRTIKFSMASCSWPILTLPIPILRYHYILLLTNVQMFECFVRIHLCCDCAWSLICYLSDKQHTEGRGCSTKRKAFWSLYAIECDWQVTQAAHKIMEVIYKMGVIQLMTVIQTL